MFKDDITASIDFWLETLNLQQWRVEWKIVETMKNNRALFEITPTRSRQSAVINIRKECCKYAHKDFQELLVHEIVHLLFDPIAAEHQTQLQFTTDKEHHEENKSRFNQILEQQVEKTALILCAIFGDKEPLSLLENSWNSNITKS